MAANVPDPILNGGLTGSVAPVETRVGKTKARPAPTYFGGDELSHADMERELEALWLAHVAPHISQADNESH